MANDLERDIERCIISPTEVSDDASSTLREIRRNIKISNDRIKEQLNSIIHSASYRNMLQDPVITIRNDRYCVNSIKSSLLPSSLIIVFTTSKLVRSL